MKKFLAILTVLVITLVIAPKTYAEAIYLPTKTNVSISPSDHNTEVNLDVPRGKVAFIFSKYIEQDNNLILGTIIPVNPGRYTFNILTEKIAVFYPNDDNFLQNLRDIISTSLEDQSIILFLESNQFASFITTTDSLRQTTIKCITSP